MTSQFGQFCPIALASEVLSQKWMFLVIRELNVGATRFNEIKRGVPRISASLLKTRLDQLEGSGIVERRPIASGGPEEYLLTEAGRELKQVLSAIGTWGQRWARDIEQEDLDPGWLVWAMHRRIDTQAMPEGRTVIAIQFTDAPSNHRAFWLVCDHPEVEVCLKPPGFDEDVRITTGVRTMAEVWRGIRPLQASIAEDALRIDCMAELRDQVPDWLMLSIFAGVKSARG
jgi:DNA-binding HxlR family transcriptional regulator